MSNNRVLSPAQIEEAKKLRNEKGFSKRDLAELYEVSPTTIWYTIYGTRKKAKRTYLYRPMVVQYVDIKGFLSIVEDLRKKGLTSAQVALVFDVPIEQINKIWCKTL